MLHLTPKAPVRKFGPLAEGDEEAGTMDFYADAVFNNGTHFITVSANRGELFLRDMEVEGCEDASVCVCRVRLTRNPEEAKRCELGGSIVDITVSRLQPLKFVVVTDGERILTVCAVRHA
jgi:hypothetical protein